MLKLNKINYLGLWNFKFFTLMSKINLHNYGLMNFIACMGSEKGMIALKAKKYLLIPLHLLRNRYDS